MGQLNGLDSFTQAYVEAMLWSSTLEPFGTCPDCDKDGEVLCKWNDDREYVCSECGTQDTDYEPPADDNYSAQDISLELWESIKADCARFQTEQAEWITDGHNLKSTREYSTDERAGHDFWLTRAGHGCGFWDGDWSEPAATKLTEASKAFGEVGLYVGDDGRIYS